MTDSDRIAALWLDTLGELATLAAHEIRNPLNGALLNIAVVTQRAGRGAVSPADIAPFAEAAGNELERVTTLTEALLALARPAPARADVWSTALHLTTLLHAVASKNGGGVTCRRTGDGPTYCEARTDLVRVLLGFGMLCALGPSHNEVLECTVDCDDSAVRVTLAGPSVERVQWKPDLRAVAEHGGVALVATRGETEIVFSTT